MTFDDIRDIFTPLYEEIKEVNAYEKSVDEFPTSNGSPRNHGGVVICGIDCVSFSVIFNYF